MKHVKKIILIIIVMCLLAGMLFAGFQIFTREPEYMEAKATYREAEKTFVEKVPENKPDKQPAVISDPKNTQDVFEIPVSVDFESLQAVNPDIIGWIYYEGTTLSQPVLLGATNDTYLHHMYNGQYNYAGSIFMDYRNTGFNDKNMILYGHNMSSKIMFHCLPNCLDQNFLNEHPVIYILTPEQNYSVELFAALVTSYSSPLCLYQAVSNELECWNDKVDSIIANARATRDIEITQDSQIVMMSTCSYEFENARCVVFGKLTPIDTEDNNRSNGNPAAAKEP